MADTANAVQQVASGVSANLNPWQEITKAISNAIGYVVNGFVQTSQIGASQRVTLNQQNNDWNLGVINSASKNYAFLAVGVIVIITLIVIISKHKSH
ncbi:MAG: hypothetical protein H6543_03310 [Prevotellaceae bacterium]|jgi:hypothetical protein|nr:hypothetical protein [Prevotellaceae bacterium]